MVPFGPRFHTALSSGRSLLWLRYTQYRAPRDLLQMLYHTRPTQSSDPRDKIYGLLGVASDGPVIVPHPNYSHSVIEVHTELFKNMTRVRKNLDWLSLAYDHGKDSKLPSWCPDLTKQSPVVSINTSRSMANGNTSGFCAAGNTLPDIRFDSSTCIIKGFLIDEVDGLGAKQQAVHKWDSDDKLLQPLSKANAYQTDFNVSEATWITLVADQGFEGTQESWRAPPYFRCIYAKQLRALKRNSSEQLARKYICLPILFNQQHLTACSAPETSTLGNWFLANKNLNFAMRTIESWTSTADLMKTCDPVKEADHEFERRLRSTISGRRLITTANGYLGIAYDSVRRGDKICIALGGRMPLILRPIEDTFQLVGECYIHGLMFGEALKAEDSSPEELILS
jgi:hypothetical protein